MAVGVTFLKPQTDGVTSLIGNFPKNHSGLVLWHFFPTQHPSRGFQPAHPPGPASQRAVLTSKGLGKLSGLHQAIKKPDGRNKDSNEGSSCLQRKGNKTKYVCEHPEGVRVIWRAGWFALSTCTIDWALMTKKISKQYNVFKCYWWFNTPKYFSVNHKTNLTVSRTGPDVKNMC